MKPWRIQLLPGCASNKGYVNLPPRTSLGAAVRYPKTQYRVPSRARYPERASNSRHSPPGLGWPKWVVNSRFASLGPCAVILHCVGRETAKTGRTACAHASGAETRERPFALTCCLARPAPQRTNVVLLCPEPNCPRIHLNYRRSRALGRECSAIGVKLGIREFK